ncbi:MAG: class I SAM-dependent methyltransferase [Gammaproteobacteria bacterium]
MHLSGRETACSDSQACLPAPTAAALAHSHRLTENIRAGIEANHGHISFKRYMQKVLYEPGLGYYSAGARKFGVEGDFITAPEVSPLFSRCLARQSEQIIRALQGGIILEFGAGTGTMAVDILTELKQRKCLPEKYLILEPSADLRQRQQQQLAERVPELLTTVEWLDRLPGTPVKGLFLANEVIDAQPTHRIVMADKNPCELQVLWQDNAFSWGRVAASGELANQVERIRRKLQSEWPDGYILEINTDLPAWMRSLSDSLAQGVMLFVDYGYPAHEYYHPQRTEGTLLCHYRHRVHSDPFLYPGLQDITASVDFTAVAEAAVAAGLEVNGFTTQAHFLMACGLDSMVPACAGDNQKSLMEITRQVKILTLPGEMGERFKVIALSKQFDGALMGFELADQRRRL